MVATGPAKPEFMFARIALLSVAPCMAIALGNDQLTIFAVLSSGVFCLLDMWRQRRRCVPFPIYLLLVYAAQTSYYVIGMHSSLFDALEANRLAAAGPVAGAGHGPIQTMSIVMAAHNEQEYLKRTLDSIHEQTPAANLKEIIIVDDGSQPPLAEALKEYPEVKILRHEVRLGLIKSKFEGGNMATSDMIMFLDAHVKPEPNWVQPILDHMNINYKRVVVPIIPILDGKTWVTDKNAFGVKMMWDWSLAFNWFEDYNDLVPCMSGGLFGITRQWWHESGEYDYGMMMWGAENIEQSIRVWLCGGEIYVARNSLVAHVFRPIFPYKINTTEMYINKVRAVETWFDEYKEQYYDADPIAGQFRPMMGDISERLKLKEKLHCKPFRKYVEKFKDIFMEKSMLPKELFLIRDKKHNLCVRITADKAHIEEASCDKQDVRQQWTKGNEGTQLRSNGGNKCLDANAGDNTKINSDALLYHCYPKNQMQSWSVNPNGEIRWQDICVEGSEVGNLKLKSCGRFMAKAGDFEIIERHQAI